MTRKPTRVLLALLVLPALLLAACAGSTAAPAPQASAASGVGDATLSTTGAALRAVGGATSGPAAAPPVPAPVTAPKGQELAPQPIPVPQAFEAEKALILTASVSLRAQDPWAIADRVQAITAGLGGDVLSLAQSGAKDQKSATLTIRVPQARFNDALRQIRDISDIEVVSSSVDGKDVTDQFVDLQARLKAKQGEEQRYLALLARADKVDDILKIDTVLAQVRTQIEQLTGQVNSIKARTTFSTITVQIAPVAPAPVPTADPKAYDPAKTMERAVAALGSMMRGVLDLAIWALVFSWLPLLLLGLALIVGRTRGRALPSA